MQFLVCTGRSGSVITLLFAILGLSVIVTLLSISDYSALIIVTRFGCVELEAESFFATLAGLAGPSVKVEFEVVKFSQLQMSRVAS